jgi:Cys-tRNA(Pro) deacylase
MLKSSPVLDRIISLLENIGVEYKKIEHEPVYTSADAAKIRDTDPAEGAKAILMFADKKPVLLVVPGDQKIDFRKFKQLTGTKDLRMAKPEEVEELTGLEIGAIPPVGKAMNIPSYYDESFKDRETAVFNAGAHTVSIIMKTADLLKVEEPVIADLVKQ